MIETVSCGGVVIYRGKMLLLYKNHNGKYAGWVLPKGAQEEGENHKQTALREVKEETGSKCKIIKFLGQTNYSFTGDTDTITKTVHWFLMGTGSFYCKPQLEEHFMDVGFYKFHEAYHLLKFHDERQILRKAYNEYKELNHFSEWRKSQIDKQIL